MGFAGCARVAKLEYDCSVERLNSATVAALALMFAALIFFSTPVVAQINGTPASVTSINSGGHFNSAPGVPASVTSLGLNGDQPRNQFLTQPACCTNPLFPVNPNPALFHGHHGHHRSSFFPAGGAVYVPYPMIAEPDGADAAAQANQEQEDDDRGGPTIFDRRGSGQAARSYLDAYPQLPSRARTETESAPAAETTVDDQPQTVLVFKDGHQVEVQNYAVVGNMLYDLTPGHQRKIAIADLDLKATAKQNDDLGISFQLPSWSETNK